MRLLLDEHISPQVARELRALGHDVVAVAERSDPAREIGSRPVRCLERPAARIVTRDLGDFCPLLARALRSGKSTWGLVCLPQRLPLSRDGISPLVGALEALLRSHPETDAAIRHGGEIWLDASAEQ